MIFIFNERGMFSLRDLHSGTPIFMDSIDRLWIYNWASFSICEIMPCYIRQAICRSINKSLKVNISLIKNFNAN